MEDDGSRELEETVEMKVEQSEETVEHASEVDTHCKLLTKVPTSVGCAENWTWPEPFEWPGPSALATQESSKLRCCFTNISPKWNNSEQPTRK